MQPAPKPKDFKPSSFVEGCLKAILHAPNELAADLACGYGRHVRLLEKAGYFVLAIDLDIVALRSIRKENPRTSLVCVDLRASLPLKAGSLGLAVAVHFPIPDLIPLVATALAPGGYAILESVGGRGGNWQELPKKGEMRRRLSREFQILKLQEREVGPLDNDAVTVGAFVRRKRKV